MESERQEMTLGHFVEVAARMSSDDFLRRFREPVLLAMGVLETEELEARLGRTSEIRVSRPLAYDRGEVHPLAGKIFRLPVLAMPQGTLVIGRDEPAEVVVPDETVSVRHCALTWNKMEVRVTDLGSTNGTFVNLRPVERDDSIRLGDEDILTVGRHSFQFYRPAHFFRVLRGLAAAAE